MDPPQRSVSLIILLFTLLLYLQFLPGTALSKILSLDFVPFFLSNVSLLSTSALHNGSLWLTKKAPSLSSGTAIFHLLVALHNPAPSISTNLSFSIENPNLVQLPNNNLFILFLSNDALMSDLLSSRQSIKYHSIFSLEFNITHLILSTFKSVKAEAVLGLQKLKKDDLITAGIIFNIHTSKIDLTACLAEQRIKIITEENLPENLGQHFYFGFCFSQDYVVKPWSLSYHLSACQSLLSILLGTTAPALAIEFLLPLAFSSTRKWLDRKTTERAKSQSTKHFRKFKLIELSRATNQFSSHTQITRGRNYDLHTTKLPDSPTTYILKRFKVDARSRRRYLQELSMIHSLRHESMLELKGWCDKYPYENLLVYEFMPNGNLQYALQSQHLLSWSRRNSVAIKVAETLTYLHEECLPHLVHGDIKSKNILLDADFEPKLAGCGHALRGPPYLGAGVNWEYAAPECRPGAEVDEKADVYSYGVLLLEICSGRMPIGNARNFVSWFKEMQAADRLLDGADEQLMRLDNTFEAEKIEKLMKVGLVCTEDCKERRPSMRWVVKMLKGEEEMR